ncbi:MAG TPA: hypothetical protein VK624_04295 [Steroidobacteraceae bacterium]|nr:hypothetical protein [Steroidobacteraceae bacterium]
MFSRDAQHTAVSAIATPPLTRILWQTPVDLAPQYAGGRYLLTHYGSPVISGANTVLVPVKTAAQGSFRIEARSGSNGALLWSATSDYVVPPHNWFPSFNLTITANNRVYAPGAGGKLYYRDNVDSASGTLQTAVFYGASVYAGATAALDAAVMVSTPITVDAAGNAWFGFFVGGANPAGLSSGVARLSANGVGTWQAASVLANDNGIDRVAMNSAPALSTDGATLYVAVSNSLERGYLLAIDSATLAIKTKVSLIDPQSGTAARIPGDGTASPTIGPDGDVYFGVLESIQGANNSRGWMLHFNATLSQTKVPGAFGWDNTASIVPAASVPSYTGTSTYLLATKYNNYAGSGTGNGLNRMAVLDPAVAQTDPISGIQTMKEIVTILGPTPDADNPGGRREWCVNTGAFDPATRSMLVNNEDGFLYRWDLATNTLSESIRFNNGIGQSYTPTAVGPDGTIFAINNAVLFAVGR